MHKRLSRSLLEKNCVSSFLIWINVKGRCGLAISYTREERFRAKFFDRSLVFLMRFSRLPCWI